ncbi:MAG TPA: peptidylprolyl isomerase [Terriglobales bacterium]|nr:peptidylprolyl isomerase [Terriglobales bacterium]
MRRTSVIIFLALFSLLTFAQTAKKPVKPAAPAPARPKAIIQTNLGSITCTLFPDKTPLTVQNFIGLAEGTKPWINPVSHAKKEHTPLYDGTIFHRVIPGFMIQGGDPAGSGSGDPGYKFRDEITDLKFDRPGRLAMANSGPDTNGSQFFITEVPTPHLNGHHTIFGQCENLPLVTQIAHVPRDANDKPLTKVRIEHIKIVQPGATAAPPAKAAPARKHTEPAKTTPAKKPAAQ